MINKFNVTMSMKSLILLTIFISCLSLAESTLKLVLMVHRHGDRNPIRSYPNDPYKNESLWPDGFGELRAEGKVRLYKMGQMLRNRYKDFLTDNPREVHVRSSAADRCLESVSSLLAGCYPPSGRWVWNDQLHWQPFPIQTKPRPQDGMLVTTSTCPAAEAELRKIRQSKEVKEYTEQYRDLFHFLHLNSGANVTDIIEAGNLCDVLRIERLSGHKLPSWVTDDIMRQLFSILDMTFYFDFSTKEVQKFRSGLLFKDMITRLKYFMGESRDQPSDIDYIESMHNKKLFLYSSHDTQIAVTLQAMGQFNMLAPPYGSSIIFELHEKEPQPSNDPDVHNFEKHWLKVFYWNRTDTSDMLPLVVPGCTKPGPCPAKRFIESIKYFIPKDWSSECSLSVIDRINSAMYENLIVVIMFGLMSMVLIAFIYMFVKRNKSRRLTMEDLDELENSFDPDDGTIN